MNEDQSTNSETDTVELTSSGAQVLNSDDLRLLELTEQIGKAAILGLAILYAVGLIVTNGYLAQYGISEFELLRSRFVLTGVLTLLPILVSYCVGWIASVIALNLISPSNDRWIHRETLRYVVLIVLTYVGTFLAFLVVVAQIDPSRSSAGVALNLALVAAIPAIHAASLRIESESDSITKRLKPRRGWWQRMTHYMAIRDTGGMFLLLAAVVVIGMLYLSLFVKGVYGTVPEQFGGGKPIPVELLFDPSQRQKFAHLEVPVHFGTSLTNSVDLIWNGDQGYLVRFEVEGKERVVLIDRELVDAIILD